MICAAESGHQMQGQSNARADSGAGDHFTVIDEPFVRANADARIESRELIEIVPVRRCGTVGEETSSGEDQRSSAHAGHERSGLPYFPHPLQVTVVGQLLTS